MVSQSLTSLVSMELFLSHKVSSINVWFEIMSLEVQVWQPESSATEQAPWKLILNFWVILLFVPEMKPMHYYCLVSDQQLHELSHA